MSFIQPSIEGPPSSVQDPWDWTVDQVVFALTDRDSQLLRNNAQLSLPDASIFAGVLRENDVTGLALLTEVTTHCLRDELGIKSLGQRAAINHLIRQLQEISLKFQEQTHRSARLSSVGFGSRMASPYFATPLPFEPRAASRALGSMFSPDSLSGHLQNHFAPEKYPAQLHNILQEGPPIQGLDRPSTGILRSSEQDGEGLGINMTEGKLDHVESGKTVDCPGAGALSREEHSSSSAKESSNIERAECQNHRGESIVIDEHGRKRRRLMIAPPGPAHIVLANSPKFSEPASSPETLRKDTDVNPSFESNVLLTSDCPVEKEQESLVQEPPVPVQATISIPGSTQVAVNAAADHGSVWVDENGRKRTRPVLLHVAHLSSEGHRPPDPVLKKENDTFGSPAWKLQGIKHAEQKQQHSFSRMAKRTADQIYLGSESLPIDSVIYGDVALGENLDKAQTLQNSLQSEQPDEPDDFWFVSNNNIGEGSRLYVNARIKHFLRAQRLLIKRNGRDHIGILPYPDVISKKNYPLSMTMFSSSSHGVTGSRVNRLEWNRECIGLNATETDGRIGSIFNVAEPALACDEGEDPEWRALEKWNFLDWEYQIIPV